MARFFKFIFWTILLGIGLIFLLLIVERNKKVTLPAPTGNYAVGRTSFVWTDSARPDTLGLMPDTIMRKLFLWVWYPAVKTNSQQQTEYLPEEWRNAVSKRQGLFVRFFTRKLSKIRSHSVQDGTIAPGAPFPVVLIHAGLGASSVEYTTFAEELASNGYVVIGAESPYTTNVIVFPDGKVVNDNSKGNAWNVTSVAQRNRRLDRLLALWRDDLKFIAGRLEEVNKRDSSNILFKRINPKQIGIFGHALGGATAFRFCFTDRRCKAGVSINSSPFGNVTDAKLNKPYMFLMADQEGAEDAASRKVQASIGKVYGQLARGRVWMTVAGARHYNFSDQALIRERFIARWNDDLGPIGEERGLQVAAVAIRTFFDVHLKGAPENKIVELKEKYPELKEVKK